jgi:hypothetical protein
MAAEITLQAQIQGLRTAVEGRLGADEQAPKADLPWRPGERVAAVVEATRPGDRGFVRIGPLLFDAKLPPGTAAGQRLNLEFVSASPRATFVLADAPEAPPSGTPSRAPVDISPAGRNLNALVQTVAPERGAGPAAVRDPVPLLPAAPREAAPLASALQRSLAGSGLFYESHLAQWVAGERPLGPLREEPQGRLPARPLASAPAQGVPAPPASADVEQTSTAAAPAAAARPAEARASEAIDQRVTAQVRAQLESLDARQVVWQGQPWPGVSMDWRIDEPPEEERTPGDPVPWTSRLKLRLPLLGEVTAELVLTGDLLRVRLHAVDAASRTALADGRGLLLDALHDASLRLAQFTVDE